MPWIFEWFEPDQDPNAIPDPNPAPTPFLISDPMVGRSVRFRSLIGASGPPYIPVNQEIPFLPGSVSKFINVDEAEVDLRVLIQAATQELLWAQLQPLPWIFNPLRGQGILQVTNPIGAVRRLNSTCISGFKIDESTLQEKSVEATLSFYANDPFWYSGTRHHEQFNPAIVGGNNMFPIFPLWLNRPGDTVYDLVLNNAGDVNSYPYITIVGPAKDVIIINNSLPIPDLQQQLDMSANGGLTVGTGTTIFIDFFNKTLATGAARVSRIDKLTVNSNFWPLQPGDNNIRIQLLDATPQTVVNYRWRDAYSTMI